MMGCHCHRAFRLFRFFLLIIFTFTNNSYVLSATTSANDANTIAHSMNVVVVGSLNEDVYLPVPHWPTTGENICTIDPRPVHRVGGKGCTQAVAAAQIMWRGSTTHHHQHAVAAVHMVGHVGADRGGRHILETLQQQHPILDASLVKMHTDLPTGQGFVFPIIADGSVCAVVTGGANILGWDEHYTSTPSIDGDKETNDEPMNSLLEQADLVLLQCEIPASVNAKIARRLAKLRKANAGKGCIVCQDVGGAAANYPWTTENYLPYCDYLTPNESELIRMVRNLVKSTKPTKPPANIDALWTILEDSDATSSSQNGHDNPLDDDAVVVLARYLQEQHGARNVLVTRGSRGATLVMEAKVHSDENNNKKNDSTASNNVIHQRALALPPHTVVVDETGAGDAFRAAWGVRLVETMKQDNSNDKDDICEEFMADCLLWATAAGACAVTRQGAVTGAPTRSEIQALVDDHCQQQVPQNVRGGGGNSNFPFDIGSRLNSMKDRPDLWEAPVTDVREWVRRQATVPGLTCVDFNFPQHFHTWTNDQAKSFLDLAGLQAGAVCLRYPAPEYVRGALNHPDPQLRQEAIELTKQAAQAALDLGAREVIIWSAFDGYDYPFQVHYDDKWDELVSAFQQVCDAFPTLRFSVEFKPTDENTRFFTIPSTGAAVLMCKEVDRDNFGLTLDVGHMLMAGENPGQSISLVGRIGKLFGIQLNDGYTRLAAEDGLIFGSIHPGMALEIMYQLHRVGFDGHIYFDTFPQRSDPVEEAAYNIRRVKAFWKAATQLDAFQLRKIHNEHDAVGALKMVDAALANLLR